MQKRTHPSRSLTALAAVLAAAGIWLALAPLKSQSQSRTLDPKRRAAPAVRSVLADVAQSGEIACDVTFKSGRNAFVLGRRIVIRLKCDASGYLTLLHYDDRGELQIISPSVEKDRPVHLEVKANQQVTLGELLGVKFYASEPLGASWLLFVVTKKPHSLIPLQRVRAFKFVGAEARRVASDFKARLSELDEDDWGAGDICFEVYRDKAVGACH